MYTWLRKEGEYFSTIIIIKNFLQLPSSNHITIAERWSTILTPNFGHDEIRNVNLTKFLVLHCTSILIREDNSYINVNGSEYVSRNT